MSLSLNDFLIGNRNLSITKAFVGGCAIMLMAFVCCTIPSLLFAATVTVPSDYLTIQEAVDNAQNDANPGEVIINSNDTFDESVYINESLILKAGDGFTPVIEKTDGYFPPIRIRATQDSDTSITLEGLTIQAYGGAGPPESNVNEGISISNVASANTLDVTIKKVTVEVIQVQSGISVASATINGNIALTVTNSSVQIEGSAAGSPECLRLEPYGYNLTASLNNNSFRFSGAGGISIQGGRDDKLISSTIESNLLEGFDSDNGSGWTGIYISGTGASGNNNTASPTQTTVSNNMFTKTASGVDVNGQMEHTHTVAVSNNTVVGSSSGGLYFVAYGSSIVNATVKNNIIAYTQGGGCGGGYGLSKQESSSGVVNLTNDYNLLYDNVAGNYSGAIAGTHSLIGDPMFVDPNLNNYHLSARSPAINAGICGEWISQSVYARIAPYLDYEGDPRCPGIVTTGCCDIGADEYIPSTKAMTWIPLLLLDN
jgi:hypothetical protein